ncbi:ABC transporter ATP-binding protein [Litorivicinus sp.]|jgi:lipoprotein-releasing system ATP-binding protein|nr:ABC transporter ATP-binding protein [Litorivicinus sp.]MDC1240051.1 ABC transporter ATP-binding protein [Litorivicinus sp.]|tara:strand:- start:50985 stop:51668 length:684 start_codon:yes stop_codon:yes gene_type:complete
MSDETLLALRNVSFSYGTGETSTVILDNVDLSVRTGGRLSLMGRSGSGKSTLMNILAGLLLPSSGSVCWLGRDVQAMSDSERVAMRRKTIGVVYQFHHLLPEFSAEENVMLPAMLAGESSNDAKVRAVRLLDRVGLAARMDHRPGELSGGERQRVAIARALSAEPSVLLMDEPTGNLDETTADHVLSVLLELSETTKTSLVIVTHDRRVASQTDECFELHHGQLGCR